MRIKIVHAPRKIFEDGVQVQYQVMIPAIGIWQLADMLSKHGHDVEIIHTGIEELLDAQFDLPALVRDECADYVCFSLHWHHQLHEVYEASLSVSTENPGAKIVLGGITATAFANEIIDSWPHINFILRGEAELSMLQLINSNAANPETIPGLSWRKKDGTPVHNPNAQNISPISENWSFTALKKMRHHELFSGSYYYDARETSFEKWARQERTWYLYAGRGCSVECSFCGGGRNSHSIMSGRNTVGLREPIHIAADMMMMYEDFDTRTFALCFHPPGMNNEYYEKLFSLLPQNHFSMIFEYYNRQSPESFINNFSKTFNNSNTQIIFSPTAFSSAIRKTNCPSAPDNDEIEFALKTAEEFGIQITLFYSPLPMEPESDILRGLDIAKRWLDKYNNARVVIMPIEIEPLSPWTINPEKYGMNLKRKTFEDYMLHHSKRRAIFTEDDLGYEFNGFDKIMHTIKTASDDPRWMCFFPYMFNPADKTH